MTGLEFKKQIDRLVVRFGERAFDEEFLSLVWRELFDASQSAFERFCDVLIESRPHHRVPLMADFREFAIAERNRAFKTQTQEAARSLRIAPHEKAHHLRVILNRDFGGESALEAMQKAKAKATQHDEPEPDGAA